MKVFFRNKVRADRLVIGLVLVVSLTAFAITFTFPPPILRGDPGPAFFPRLIIVVSGTFCSMGLYLALASHMEAEAGVTARKYRQ